MTQLQKQRMEGKILTHGFMGLKSTVVGDVAVGQCCPSRLEHVVEISHVSADERGEEAGWKHRMGYPLKPCP